jgi:hypothetical protein
MRHFHIASASLLALALALAMGCSSSPEGPKRTAKAVESFKTTRDNIAEASGQVQLTNESLKQLTMQTEGDLRSSFNKYDSNVKKTQSIAEGARKRAAAMRENTDAYVAQWRDELGTIDDPELRKISESRATAAKAEFEKIRSLAQDARTAYEPYRKGLEDVQKYLANDLTAGGVQAVQPKATATIAQGDALHQKLMALQTELDGLSQKWSSKLQKSSK